ncbi:hypothetical protein ER308_08400 [Egibacter rhizosphaerae]|uniref:Uncharacterized protein n=1 Tax=Egibacter rhizosphaerae TaxID=1670831 RepID=A0A411YEC6_9ACTN|nr:hypothetical protein [Egibacter rhizosphaerae]QBI19569.1 hypothetical protein ER308_08400 [Egibacter rhizosphaerae]
MRLTRLCLAVLAAAQLYTGVWALAAPASFYADFPGFGSAWVAPDGPFNHHLVVDAGAGFLATGLALAVAAAWPHWWARLVSLVAYLAHALPHLAYHVVDPPGALPPLERALSWGLLAVGAAAATALLAWTVRTRERDLAPVSRRACTCPPDPTSGPRTRA